VTEATIEKQATGAFERFLELLSNIEQIRQQAKIDFERATEALTAAKQAYTAASLSYDAGLIDEKELKQAAKKLEDASKTYEGAKLRFEASGSPGAFGEVVTPGSKGRRLAEEAAAEAQASMDKLQQEREQILSELEALKERYLTLVERYFIAQADERDILRQLQQIAEVVPGLVPSSYVLESKRGFRKIWQLPPVDVEVINKRIHGAIPRYRSGKHLAS